MQHIPSGSSEIVLEDELGGVKLEEGEMSEIDLGEPKGKEGEGERGSPLIDRKSLEI